MEAIATLIQDDPYLKLSTRDRLAARKDRRARFAKIRAEPPPVVVEPEPEKKPEPVFDHGQWVERQKKVWFSIESEIDAPEPLRPSIERIQRAVSRHYDVSLMDILSDRRTARVVRPRQVAMYLTKKLTLRSLPEIGRRFGHRDHTTVLHGVRKIEQLIPKDGELAADVDAIESKVRGAANGQ